MKSIIEIIQNEYDAMMFRFPDGTTICSMVKETKKYFWLYNPMRVEGGVDKNKKEYVKLVPWYPMMVTESCNTRVKKKDVIVFNMSESFKEYYVNRIEAVRNKQQNTVLKVGGEQPQTASEPESSNGNIISFDNFRKMQKGANLHVVSSNTGGNDVA